MAETTSATTAATESSTPSSETASAPAAPAEFRYQAGDGVPDSLVGKTASEAAELFNQMHRTVQLQQTQNQTQVPQAHQAQYDAFTAQRDAVLGSQARALAELRFSEDFKRWGPEIDIALTQVPAQNRTPEVMEWIVNGIRGRHASELANEAAERRVKTLLESGQLRPQGVGEGAGTGPAYRVDLGQLPPRYSAVLQNLGVTSEKVDDFLRKAYPQMSIAQAREKWFKLASKGDVITDGKSGFRYDEEDSK